MLKDGTYAAWFKTPLGDGTGVAHFRGGAVTGGDSILSYSGSYETDADRFTAVIRTKRHTPGHPSVFGLDDLTVRLEGKCGAAHATCTGRADEAPDVPFEATLMLSQPEDPKPRQTPSPADFHPERLPSLPSR
jgi:hypothetical protein